jgi:hypothetical protein
MRTAVLLIATTLFGGCATPSSSPDPSTRSPPSSTSSQPSTQRAPPVNLSGYSLAFKAGYTDGCASARGPVRRDDGRYRSDNDYMMGWSDGNSVCRNRQ